MAILKMQVIGFIQFYHTCNYVVIHVLFFRPWLERRVHTLWYCTKFCDQNQSGPMVISAPSMFPSFRKPSHWVTGDAMCVQLLGVSVWITVIAFSGVTVCCSFLQNHLTDAGYSQLLRNPFIQVILSIPTYPLHIIMTTKLNVHVWFGLCIESIAILSYYLNVLCPHILFIYLFTSHMTV